MTPPIEISIAKFRCTLILNPYIVLSNYYTILSLSQVAALIRL